MIRLFIAIPLPETVRDRLVWMQAGVPGAVWQPPENFHITLRFLGEVDEGRAADADAALDTVVAPAFPLALEGLGSFGQGHRTRTLWAGVADNPALKHLRDKVESALVRDGFPVDERRYTPHVTLGRMASGAGHGGPEHEAGPGVGSERVARWLAANSLYRDGPFQVDRFGLYESVLGRSGPTYHELRSYPLGGWHKESEP